MAIHVRQPARTKDRKRRYCPYIILSCCCAVFFLLAGGSPVAGNGAPSRRRTRSARPRRRGRGPHGRSPPIARCRAGRDCVAPEPGEPEPVPRRQGAAQGQSRRPRRCSALPATGLIRLGALCYRPSSPSISPHTLLRNHDQDTIGALDLWLHVRWSCAALHLNMDTRRKGDRRS